MNVMVLNMDKEGWALEFEEEAIMSGSSVEHIKDAAPVLGKYFDILYDFQRIGRADFVGRKSSPSSREG